jgi:multiple sugar transport system permease protein
MKRENTGEDTAKKKAGSEAPRRGDGLAAVAFLAPNMVGFLVFTALPVIGALLLSFCRWNAIESWEGIRWWGLRNYAEALLWHRDPTTGTLAANDGQFWYSMYNTVYLMVGIPLGMIVSFFTALLMSERVRGIVALRTIYFIPTVCSSAAVAVLWRWMFDAEDGLINAGLRLLGVANPPDWLSDPSWAKPALIIVGLWVGAGGYNCVLYLAGLQNIPSELYEAAEIDGAGWWARLRYVTWPMLAPTTFFILVTSVIAGFQGHFTHIHILTRGGPADSTTTLLYYIYQHAFVWHNMGYACALAMVLFVLIMGFTILQWKHGGAAIESQ